VCRTVGNVQWVQLLRTRVATQVTLLVKTSDGPTLFDVAGIQGTVTPQMLAAVGPIPRLVDLLGALPYPVSLAPGPGREPVSGLLDEVTAPGTYLLYAGADLIQGRYASTCMDDGLPMAGTVSSWTDRAVGILDCSTDPPPHRRALRSRGTAPTG